MHLKLPSSEFSSMLLWSRIDGSFRLGELSTSFFTSGNNIPRLSLDPERPLFDFKKHQNNLLFCRQYIGFLLQNDVNRKVKSDMHLQYAVGLKSDK